VWVDRGNGCVINTPVNGCCHLSVCLIVCCLTEKGMVKRYYTELVKMTSSVSNTIKTTVSVLIKA